MFIICLEVLHVPVLMAFVTGVDDENVNDEYNCYSSVALSMVLKILGVSQNRDNLT